jgi:hypothetical protein
MQLQLFYVSMSPFLSSDLSSLCKADEVYPSLPMNDGEKPNKITAKKLWASVNILSLYAQDSIFHEGERGERGNGRGNRMEHIKRDMHNIL